MKSPNYNPIHKNGIIRLNLEVYNSSENKNYENHFPENQMNINESLLPYDRSYITCSKSNGGNANQFHGVVSPEKTVIANGYDNIRHSPASPHPHYYNTRSVAGHEMNSVNNNIIDNARNMLSPAHGYSQAPLNSWMSAVPCTDTNNWSSVDRSNSHSQFPQPQETVIDNQLSGSFKNLSVNRIAPSAQFSSNGAVHLPNNGYQSARPVQYPNNVLGDNSYNLPIFNSSSQSLPQSYIDSQTNAKQNLLELPPKISISTPAVVRNHLDSNRTSSIQNNTRQENSISGSNHGSLSPSRRMINVMEERLLIPTTGIMNPVPNIIHISKKANCNPHVMRSTLNAVPCNEDILSKTRLPLAILIHPFRDLADLQVIRSKQIVRCRTHSCRAYLNPFVVFPDPRRWKCNLCQRLNELSADELAYDAALGVCIDTQKRAEVRLATVEYIAPKEYSTNTPVSLPVYVFIVDLNAHGNCGLFASTLSRILSTIDELLERFPGYQNGVRFSLIGFDDRIHLFPISRRCQQLVLSDITQPIQLPTNSGLVVGIREYRDQIRELLISVLDTIDFKQSPSTGAVNSATQNCLGSALLVAKQLIDNCGGRITIFNASRPSIGEGVLHLRESKKYDSTSLITADREFYKSFSLDCSQAHIGVDLFQLGQQPCDLASLSIVSRYCGGSLFYYPDLTISAARRLKEPSKENDKSVLEIRRLLYDLNRYLTRKIGFDAVLRVRHSAGFSIHSCYGNVYTRASDMFALANVNPDSGLAVRLELVADELVESRAVFVQAALLYSSSAGERRIRVHTLCLPVSAQIDQVFRQADQQAIAGFLAKSVSDRLQSDGRVIDAREALINALVDPSRAFGEFCLSSSQRVTSLPFPFHLRMLPLFVWGLLQSRALSPTNQRPDATVAVLDRWRNAPLSTLLVDIYPSLFDITSLAGLTGGCAPARQHSRSDRLIPGRRYDYIDQSDSCSTTDEVGSIIDDPNEPEMVLPMATRSAVYTSDSENSSWDSDADADADVAGSGISCYGGGATGQSARPADADEERSSDDEEEHSSDDLWYPDQLHLTAQSMSRAQAYLLDSTGGLILLFGVDTPRVMFRQLFGVDSLAALPGTDVGLPELHNAASVQLRLFVRELQVARPLGSHLSVVTGGAAHLSALFQHHMVEDDRPDSSYHRFLQHVQRLVNK